MCFYYISYLLFRINFSRYVDHFGLASTLDLFQIIGHNSSLCSPGVAEANGFAPQHIPLLDSGVGGEHI